MRLEDSESTLIGTQNLIIWFLLLLFSPLVAPISINHWSACKGPISLGTKGLTILKEKEG